MEKIELVIIIPAYNEEKRIDLKKYKGFLQNHKNVMICFVDDGSIDKTYSHLEILQQLLFKQVEILKHTKNKGKAKAIQTGMTYAISNIDFYKIAYLDADLSTSLGECYSLSKEINTDTTFVFGSRIAKLGAKIVRKSYRFYIGRIIAYLISKELNIRVYDTQCGCKIFTKSLSTTIFKNDFISTWLFDVEVFHRIIIEYGKNKMICKSKEIPLKSWIDTDDSKVSFLYFFKMWLELYRINKKYTLKNY